MEFTVPGMNCGHCTATIEKAIKSADPAATVACNVSDRRVRVDNSLPAADLSAVIKIAGYDVRGMLACPACPAPAERRRVTCHCTGLPGRIGGQGY